MKTLLPILSLSLFALIACDQPDCPEGFYEDSDGNCLQSDDGDGTSSSFGGFGGSGGSGDSNSGSSGGSSNSGYDTGSDLAGVGDSCVADADCGSNLCLFQYSSDSYGVCTETCDSWADCSQAFWDCCDTSNGGFVCTPDSWVDAMDLTCD